MSETFSILIDSRSRFETGQPGGAWLSMPTTTEQLHAAMRSVGISAENPQEFFINGFSNTEQYPFDVPLSVVQDSTIDELNYLGKLLEMQGDEDRDKFTAAVTFKEHAGSVKDLINLAQNLDCYWIYPTVRSETDYGYYLIDELDELELPEEAKKYFKYEEYGRDAVQKDRGQFTEQGYIYNNGNTFSQWYNGRENDIPKEYKVMSFPEPEHPAPDKLEKDEAAPEQEEPQPGTPTGSPPQPRPVNPIILTADKPAEKLKEITDRLEQGITELFDSERYKEYLQVMSKFHNYSFNNTLLIAMQKPDASLIAGFNAWKNNFGRNVMRGEKGIRILAPSPYKIRQEVEKKDPQTGKTVIGSDGKPVTETKEIQIPAYKVVAVFDVSQTEGRELPAIGANELTGDVEQYEDFFAALEKTSPVPMGFEKIEGTAHGYYHLEEKRIAIDEGMSQLQNLKTAIHEIAHAKLHDIDLNAPEQPDRPDRRTREVQAESIAYTVCQHYGLDTSDYSFGYVAGWSSGRELAELKTSLETIRATAAEIINSIDGHFAELQKEREAAKAQEAEKEPTPDLSAEPTVTIEWSESPQLREGETIPLSRANTLIAGLDEANLASPGYDKVAFRIDYVMNGTADHYEGRQDLGDGDGSLVEHIEQHHTYYLNDKEWENYLLHNEGKEALEADKEHRAMLLNEFIPYLKLHCNLSEMERIAGEALQNGNNLTPTETAYHTAMQAYVAECRGLVNQGEYSLPPVPQLKDFDVELAAYKEHVKEEIAQEAADAEMTVEEYAANGYEPYFTPEPEFIYKMEANPRSESENDRFFLQAYEKEEAGKAIPRDVLFVGTPEKCRELLGKLETGELTQEQVKEIFAQAQEAQTATPESPVSEKADTPEQTGQTAEKPLTDLQRKAVEIAGKYEALPLQDKIGIVAQAFGGTEGKIETSPCTGKWRGTSDISIKFDNGASLFIGNHRTPQAKTAKVQTEYVNAALVRYNPEIIAATKEAAIAALRARETKDNEIAAQKGLKPYTLLNVEFNDGTDEKSGGHIGWYYVTLAVDGEIHSHIETGLNYDILDGKVSENPTREDYFTAGALKETDVDYVFNNVGFSSTSDLYSLPISEEVRERAEKTLAERNGAHPEKAADPQSHTAEQPEPTGTTVTYYPINENAARRAKEAISFSDYKPGSATAEYRHYVDEAAELAARQKKRVDPSFHEKIDGLLDAYARKLAANMNKGYEITARVPSIMIAGGSNFPVRKKEKQNAAADKNMQEFTEIQGLLDKIRSTGMGGISADDPNAVSKLESKLAKLEQAQETMKAVNAYYRKNKTLDGCPHLSTEQIEKLKEAMSGSYRANPKPFESYQLSNNNAEIHRLKDRITALTRRKELGYVGWEFDGGRVEANTADNRLQIFFDEKPDKEIREELKGNGFRYAPSAEAWQRQLNDNAIYAADRIKCIQPLTGESPTELQKRARQEAAAERTAATEQPQEETQDAEPGNAATPETFYKVRQNPYSDSPENSYLLQEYVAQDNGMAKLGDILYTGTPEKCRELLGKLETGELTQGDVKELYAKAQEAQPAVEPGALPDPTISVGDMKQYGYSWDGMLPLQEAAATELFEKEDMQIFLLHGDGSESIADSAEDIKSHADRGGIMGVHKEDWEALREYREMKQQLAEGAPAKEVHLLYGKEDAFGIYQLKDGAGMRDYHFEPYDRLQAAGLSVDATNYDLIYTAELTPGTSLEDIYTRFNIDHPKDFKGHSLSVSDIVVLHQNGENTAHYVDSFGYKEVPEFLQEQTPQLTPDTRMTGEQIRTPRGSFSVTDMTAEQMREAGYGLHHTSEDGKYLIMGNGTQAFAVAAEQPEKAAPTAGELEAKARSGEQISLAEYAAALKAEKEQGKKAEPGKKPEKKPSIRAQLRADKERAAQKKQARSKSQDLERS